MDLLISATIGATMQSNYNMFVYREGTRALEAGFSAITNAFIATQQREHDNATIIIHGVAPHEYSYATPFIQDLKTRTSNQDYYEFTWSGFAMTGGVVPNAISHGVASNSFRRALLTLQGKGYNNVNIVAHSWGTVISRDALLDGAGPINTWVTMGSPLPESTPWANCLQNWINIFSPDDPIVYLGNALGASGVRGGTGYLFNRNLINQVGISGGHSAYWTDPRTLDTIGSELGGQ
jgi:pimeloyl-ACP methyl ester carboxylesterase